MLVTLVNLYYKPHLGDHVQPPLHWIQSFVNPVAKTACAHQGFKCKSEEACDCEKLCANGKEFVPFQIVEGDRIYVMNQKLTPGTYCLPRGVDKCNLKTSYHVFSLAGWSCIGISDDIFKRNKKRACKNEEAQDNSLNVLWDYLENQEAGDDIDNYYEMYQNKYRYGCKCGSRSLDDSPMISPFPFVCLVDYCLRNFENPTPLMGWTGEKCECGSYFHEYFWDETTACKREYTRIEKEELIGQVDCMTKDSFIERSLICPTDDNLVVFKEYFFKGKKLRDFVDALVKII